MQPRAHVNLLRLLVLVLALGSSGCATLIGMGIGSTSKVYEPITRAEIERELRNPYEPSVELTVGRLPSPVPEDVVMVDGRAEVYLIRGRVVGTSPHALLVRVGRQDVWVEDASIAKMDAVRGNQMVEGALVGLVVDLLIVGIFVAQGPKYENGLGNGGIH